MDIEEVGAYFGLRGRVIVREAEELANLYCDNITVEGIEPGLFYPCTLTNKGNAIGVVIAGRELAQLDPRCLPQAVEVMRKSGGKNARALVSPRDPERKTAQVVARL